MFTYIFIKIFTIEIVFAKIVENVLEETNFTFTDYNAKFSNRQEIFRQFFIYTWIMVSI